MQPDYSKMAQQAAPQEQGQVKQPPTEESLNELHKQAGLPQGNDKEAIKARLLAVIEKTGFLQKLTKEGLKEFTDNLNEFVELVLKKDIEAIKNHPITKLLNSIEEQGNQMEQQGMMQQPMQPQGQPMQAAPKNFAGMMKPPGGGMSGR